jgi:hypothetical protein
MSRWIELSPVCNQLSLLTKVDLVRDLLWLGKMMVTNRSYPTITERRA